MEEFEGKFNSLKENTEKYTSNAFSVPVEKEVMSIIIKNYKLKELMRRGKNLKTRSYRLHFVDSARFISTSLSNLVNNLAEGIHKTKCKYAHHNKKCETCRIKYKDCHNFPEYTNFKDNFIEYNVCVVTKIIKTYGNDFLIHTNFLTGISIILIYCCKKVFTHTNIRMIGKNLVKLCSMKKKIFTAP